MPPEKDMHFVFERQAELKKNKSFFDNPGKYSNFSKKTGNCRAEGSKTLQMLYYNPLSCKTAQALLVEPSCPLLKLKSSICQVHFFKKRA